MKNLIKIFASVALFCSMTSCDQANEGNIYNPEVDQVSFYTNILNYGLTPDQNNVLSLPVTRSFKGAAAEMGDFALDKVELVLNGKPTDVTADNIFKLESTKANFAEGTAEGSLQFSYADINALDASAIYKLYVSNNSETISPTDVSKIVVSAQRVLTYATLEGKAKVTSEWGNADGLYEWEVNVEKAKEAEFYKLKGLYKAGSDVVLSVADDGSVSVARQKDGEIHPDYGAIFVETDPTIASVKDGKVLTLYLQFTVSAGSFGTCKEVIVLP